jgi:hypothetical protein
MKEFLKGICYEPFPHGYNPSIANNTCIWFGSDIATYNIKPLWGDSFSPKDGPDAGKVFKGRNDLQNLKDLGINLIRLYDWDSRNDHIPFLDSCHELGIKILAPVSNYNLGAFGTPPNMDESIKGLINSFKDNNKKDYHPAIYAIIIGCELDLPSQMPKGYLAEYTKRWAQIENELYNDFRKVPIGHPVSFATNGADYPCFKFWDELLPELLKTKTRDLNQRLILCPHTYNDANYLFDNAQGSGVGWVEHAYDRYNQPILFCEIGCSRLTREDYTTVIKSQIERSIEYNQASEGKLLGTCYFQYCDKVWMPNTTEGSFGLVSNTDQVIGVVNYGQKDFSHTNGFSCNNNYLNIQVLTLNPTFDVIKNVYKTC